MLTAASIAVYAIGAGLTLTAVLMWRGAVNQRRTGAEPRMGVTGAVFSVGIAMMLIAVAFIRES